MEVVFKQRGLRERACMHGKCMSKTITISDDAYARLKKYKRPGESFTDVIVESFPHPFETGKDHVNWMKSQEKSKKTDEGKAA